MKRLGELDYIQLLYEVKADSFLPVSVSTVGFICIFLTLVITV